MTRAWKAGARLAWLTEVVEHGPCYTLYRGHLAQEGTEQSETCASAQDIAANHHASGVRDTRRGRTYWDWQPNIPSVSQLCTLAWTTEQRLPLLFPGTGSRVLALGPDGVWRWKSSVVVHPQAWRLRNAPGLSAKFGFGDLSEWDPSAYKTRIDFYFFLFSFYITCLQMCNARHVGTHNLTM